METIRELSSPETRSARPAMRDGAMRLGCDRHHVDSGVHREDALRVYPREGRAQTAHDLSCRLES